MRRELAAYDDAVRRAGFPRLCGLDEAGRGPLAGPVVAAAVILPPGLVLPGLDDSKRLTPERRAALEAEIFERADAFGVGVAEAEEIDGLNILRASLLAMERAVAALAEPPDFILVDGSHRIGLSIPQRAVVKGDATSASVAAASVVAKEHRDRLMRRYAETYPDYGFEAHMGYATAEHQAAIANLGPCPLHRKTFKGVREHLPGAPSSRCLSLF